MPRQRIPTLYTLLFKVSTVDDWLAARARGESRTAFAKSRGVPRPSLQNWERQIARLREDIKRRPRAGPSLPPLPSRGSRLTLSGSGRKCVSAPIEDTLCVYIKDERRLEHTVTIDSIIEAACELLPVEIGSKSYEGQKSWCRRFMKRKGLTIRRISHSGRKTREELEAIRLPFVEKVTQILIKHCHVDRGLPVARALFNMDQTSVYWEMGSRTTVEFVGATTVPSTTNGSEGYRCTMTLTAAADGRVLPPHFVYNGVAGGDVETEVTKYCTSEVATFSAQENAWFDTRVMMEWIEKCWVYIVREPSVLILDSFSVHKKAEVADALACTGKAVLYVPGGCTGVAQPLDVGVMAPVKQHIRRLNTTRSRGRPKKVTPQFRRRSIFDTAMDGLRCVSPTTVKSAVLKAGPFIPFGPPNHPDVLPVAGNEDVDRCSAEGILEEAVV